MSELTPLLVSCREARKLLGGIGNNTFWKIVKAGGLELVGSSRKRFVVVASLRTYVDSLPRSRAVVAEDHGAAARS